VFLGVEIVLLTISFFVMMGELAKIKSPAPIWRSHVPPQVCCRPPPPVSLNPSSRSPAEFGLDGKYTVEQTVPPSFVQSERTHGWPVASIVVTAGPSVETRLIPAKTRTDSR